MKKVALITLGCPKNQVDSEVLAGELVRGGMTLVGNREEADIILINTCGFIEEAKRESIESILESVKLKENGRDKAVYVWGCMAERYRGEIEKEIPEVDAYFGVEPYREMGRFFFGHSYRWRDAAFGNRLLSTPSHTAYLKIADGCDHQCTFCAIPHFKGKYRSRSVASLMEEAQTLAGKGVKEIVLVAQDTTAYGSDIVEGSDLVSLLEKLVSVEGVVWIRIMYGHPSYINDDIIRFMAEEKKICCYLDLPLQHISNAMLQRMGRKTSAEFIRSLIQTLRDRIPDLVLRTTFIVGFPGETDAMFDELVEFVREARFERMGTFVFSPEEGTKASELRPLVSKTVAEERYRILMEVQQHVCREINRSLESKKIPVLVDGYDRIQNLYFGRSEGDGPDVDQTVWIKGNVGIGEIVPVIIEASSAYDLMGRPACV